MPALARYQAAIIAIICFLRRAMSALPPSPLRRTDVAAKPASQIPTVVNDSGVTVRVFDPTPSYNLVSFYVGYQPTPDLLAVLSRKPAERGLYEVEVYVLQQRIRLRRAEPGHYLQRFSDARYGVKGG